MKIALYVRVSKFDESQDPQNQLKPLQEKAKALGGEVIEEYIDMASGNNGDRLEFQRMLDDADKRKFDLLLFWSLDRMSREGISNTFGYIKRLKRSGVGLISLQESWLDTREEGVGPLLLAVFSWVAQQERMRIVERTKAGLERAKNQGKRLGRPKGSMDKKQRIRSCYSKRRYAKW